jgi:hypothetical protein
MLLPSVLVFMCMCLCCVSMGGYRFFTSQGLESAASRPSGQEEDLETPEKRANPLTEPTLGTQTSPLAEPAPVEPPGYEVRMDSSGEGGVTQEILISPEDATQEKLDALARHLAQGIPAEQNITIRIYDDQAVVGLASQPELPPEQQQGLYAHWRASYTRNLAEGVHKLEIWTSDHQVEAVIDYTQQ